MRRGRTFSRLSSVTASIFRCMYIIMGHLVHCIAGRIQDSSRRRIWIASCFLLFWAFKKFQHQTCWVYWIRLNYWREGKFNNKMPAKFSTYWFNTVFPIRGSIRFVGLPPNGISESQVYYAETITTVQLEAFPIARWRDPEVLVSTLIKGIILPKGTCLVVSSSTWGR